MKVFTLSGVLCLLLVGVSGCGDEGPLDTSLGVDAPQTGAAGLTATVDGLRGRLELAAREIPADWITLSDVLPSDGVAASARESGELVAVGQVVDVRQGASYRWETTSDGQLQTIELAPGSKDAWIRTAYVELATTRVASASEVDLPGQTVAFGLSFLPEVDLETVATELRSVGEVVVVLRRGSAFPADPEVWNVLADGEFLGFVKDGAVEFPALNTGIYPPGFLPTRVTVDSLFS